ncbi:PAGE5 isoform 1 [Pongo abelii]|uniref:PAGE5 isoform 1 n=1 Tax=Pongo abelii TaxID=9601 RepID=A0A2J8R420_PONAB|nr:PAGE5 isoform 1 [Pongo abelii]
MSEHVTRSQSSERGNDQESSQPVGPVIVQEPTEEKRQEEEPPTDNQGPDLEAFQQEFALLKIEDAPGDGPDVREGTLPTFDPTKVLEEGEGKL